MNRILLLGALLFSIIPSLIAQKRIADSLIQLLPQTPPDTNRVNMLRMICGALSISDQKTAIQYGYQALEIGHRLKYSKGLAGTYLNLGTNFIRIQKFDSALKNFDNALHFAKADGDPNRLALIYLNIADVHISLNKFSQSLVYCDSSLRFAEKANSDDRKARVYQTIGNIYYKQDNFSESIPQYEKAIGLYKKINNLRMEAIVLNNLGNIYKHQGNYDQSVNQFNRAIKIADSLGDMSSLPLYFNNISDAFLIKGDINSAELYAGKAITEARKQKNLYHTSVALAHFAEINIKKGNYNDAVQYASQAYNIAKEEELLEWQHVSADLLSEAYHRMGNNELAYDYLLLSKEMNDSLIKAQYTEDIAQMQTLFKLNEKDNEILLLNNEAVIKKAQLNEQRLYIFGILFIALLAIAGIGYIVNRNRLKQRLKELELRNRIAADLHDEVGSSLSSIHVLSHMASKSENGKLGETLQKITQSSRQTMDRMSDIVWAIQPGNDSIDQLVFKMKEFASDILDPLDIQYKFYIEDDLRKIKIGINKRRDLFLIFKEAVNNIAKYSNCRNVDIHFHQKGSQLQLKIADDGKGFDSNLEFPGNGLTNMKHRTRQIGGELSIDSSPGNGTIITLTI